MHMNLIASAALPVLTYSLEALSLNKTELNALNHPWERSFQKLFHTFDSQTIKYCQLYNGYFPMLYYYALRSMSFLKNLAQSPNLLMRHIYSTAGHEDVSRLAKLFNCESTRFLKHHKAIIYADFSSKL